MSEERPPDSASGAPNPSQIPPEILAKLPEHDRQRVLEVFSAAMWSGPIPNPVIAKISSQHISDMIALASKSADLNLSDRQHSRIFTLLTLTLILSASVGLLVVFAIHGLNDLATEVLKLLAVGLGSFGGGFGFAKWRRGD